MTIDQLQAFVVAVREGTITRAARYLFVEQSSLSRRIQSLEAELGCQLLQRRGQGVVLTEKGQLFLPYAQDIVLRAEEARRLVGSKPGVFASTLVVGATPSLATYVLPRWLREYAQRTPKAPRITVRTGVSTLRHLLEDGQVDLVLSRSVWHGPNWTSESLTQEPLALVARPGHPLAVPARPLSPEELSSQSFICSEFFSQYWQDIERYLGQFGLRLSVAMDVDHCDMVKEMVAHSDYLAFLPYSAAAPDLEAGRLVSLTLEGHPFPPCAAYVIYSPSRNHPERERFLNYLRGLPTASLPTSESPPQRKECLDLP